MCRLLYVSSLNTIILLLAGAGTMQRLWQFCYRDQ